MDIEQVKFAVDECLKTIDQEYPFRFMCEFEKRDQELEESEKFRSFAVIDPQDRYWHLRFMCRKTIEFMEAGRTEKAMRWLGFIQGVIWASNFCSIETMKYWNMPKP